MRCPSLLSGPKIRKAYFGASNRKMLIHRPHLNQILREIIEVKFLDLKPQSRLYEFLVEIKVMDFSFYWLYQIVIYVCTFNIILLFGPRANLAFEEFVLFNGSAKLESLWNSPFNFCWFNFSAAMAAIAIACCFLWFAWAISNRRTFSVSAVISDLEI